MRCEPPSKRDLANTSVLGSGPDALAQVFHGRPSSALRAIGLYAVAGPSVSAPPAADESAHSRRLLQLLNPTVELVAVYYQQRFCLLSLAEFAVLLLEMEEAARIKLLPKMKQLQRDIYHLLQNARPP